MPEYAAISTLRALKLKEANPTAWNSMQGLMDHCDERLRFYQNWRMILFGLPKEKGKKYVLSRSCPKTVKYHQTFLVDFLKRGMPQSFGNFADHEIHRYDSILAQSNRRSEIETFRISPESSASWT